MSQIVFEPVQRADTDILHDIRQSVNNLNRVFRYWPNSSPSCYLGLMDLNAPVEPEELARRIRMIMGDQRWSRKHLSEVTGISRPSLSNKLNGDVSFTYDELVVVIDALGVAWEELLANPFPEGRTGSTSPPRLNDLHYRRDRRL